MKESNPILKALAPEPYLKLAKVLLVFSRKVAFSPVNLPVLLRAWASSLGYSWRDLEQDKKLKARLRARMWRRLKKWAQLELVILEKEDGLWWITPTWALVDLIRRHGFLKPHGGKPIHPLRFLARSVVAKKRQLKLKDWERLFDFFIDYYEDVDRKVLVFLPIEGTGTPLLLSYKHRFRPGCIRKKLKQFKALLVYFGRKYKHAVFITLTMDPKMYFSILEGRRKAQEAWNRLRAFLRKKFGRSIPFIACWEPQDSGNPHLHVVFFGIRWIGDHYELTEILKRLGFGEIHYEYQLAWNGQHWVWRRRKPRDAHQAPGAYLSKYLRKALYAVLEPSFSSLDARLGSEGTECYDVLQDWKIAWYFATGARFFTYGLGKRVKRRREEIRKGRVFYVFIGAYYRDQLMNREFWLPLEKLRRKIYDLGPGPPPIDFHLYLLCSLTFPS